LALKTGCDKTCRGKIIFGDLVWKMILPLGSQSVKFGKWSPGWEGPFRDIWVVPGNAYFMEDLEGHMLPKALNEKYLKCYYPSI
jgi:hypothetical protein